jgi:hypothetical protein
MDKDAKEAIFQDAVKHIALMCGWLVDHTPPMRYPNGAIRTGGMKGKPDLCLIHPAGRGIIWAELKTEKGRLTPEQEKVIHALRANGAEVYVWRPSMLDLIATRLGKSA